MPAHAEGATCLSPEGKGYGAPPYNHPPAKVDTHTWRTPSAGEVPLYYTPASASCLARSSRASVAALSVRAPGLITEASFGIQATPLSVLGKTEGGGGGSPNSQSRFSPTPPSPRPPSRGGAVGEVLSLLQGRRLSSQGVWRPVSLVQGKDADKRAGVANPSRGGA